MFEEERSEAPPLSQAEAPRGALTHPK